MNPFSTLSHLFKPQPHLHPDVQGVLHRVAATLNDLDTAGKMAVINPAFTHELAAPVSHALEYCDALVAGIPGVIDIGHGAFSADPLVHALFASPTDIDAMLGRSLHLREYLGSPPTRSGEYLYSLLAMRRQEKATTGIELAGTALRTGVPQNLLYFTDHTLVEPGDDLDTIRSKLRITAFDSLMTSFSRHLKAIYQERQHLRDDRAFENAHLAVLRGQCSEQEYTVHTRRIAELDEQLAAIAESMQPIPLLKALADFLSRPETSLRLEPVEICVDRSGVIRSGEAAASGNGDTIGFPELVARDRRRHVVVLARFRRQDAERAIADIRDQQARFIII